MLIINKQSWHFRLYSAARDFINTDSPLPGSLCGYFWSWNIHVAIYLFMVTLMAALLALIIGFTPVCLWSWLVNHSASARDVILIIWGAIGFLVLCGFIYFWAGRLKNKVQQSQGLSGLGVVGAFIKATKEKVCPFIEYREE